MKTNDLEQVATIIKDEAAPKVRVEIKKKSVSSNVQEPKNRKRFIKNGLKMFRR